VRRLLICVEREQSEHGVLDGVLGSRGFARQRMEIELLICMMKSKTIRELRSERGGVINLLPDAMEEVTRLDAEYHAEVRREWIDLNQMHAQRNLKFHGEAIAELARGLGNDAVILELGSGVGYDAKRFLELNVPFGCYVVSEIAPSLLEHSKKELMPVSAGREILYCCLTADSIRIADKEFDRIFAVATVHHFPNLSLALREIDRVAKPGAKIIFAMEPNRFWSKVLVALRPIYRRLFAQKSHSAADDEAEGFTLRDLRTMGADFPWEVERIVPVWFFAGFLHNGLEFLYRLLRLRKRITVPNFIEKLLLGADSVFFRIPYCDRWAWHYTIVFKK
jgi:SAM-dependent methyltransferase